MRFRPISPARLVVDLAERLVTAAPDTWLRAAIDGAPPTNPDELADAIAHEIRPRRPVVRVRATDYLRAASLRLEHGREDPDAFYAEWLDIAALSREALGPLDRGGSGLVRAVHRDPATDRASRQAPVPLAPGGLLLLSGGLLLGAGLAIDVAVHLAMSPAALARRMPAELAWTLPAYERYAGEVGPEAFADVLVRMDDPRHPAVLTGAAAT